jgi:hypothetical protein
MSKTHADYAPRLGLVTRWRTRNGGLLLTPIWVVLAFGLALPMFNHVGWVLALVGLAAIAAGSVLGGGDRTAGAEEYVMALPPSRHEQYWIRAALGLVVPLAALLGIAIVKFDLSAHLWGLVCSSGWNVPTAELSSRAYVIAAFLIPTALFAVSYGGATLGGLPGGLLLSLIVAAACGASAMIESLLWRHPTGSILLPVVGVVGILALVGCYPLYLRRDMVAAGRRGQAMAVVVVVAVLALLAFLILVGTMRPVAVRHEMPPQSIPADMPSSQHVDMTQSIPVDITQSTPMKGGE